MQGAIKKREMTVALVLYLTIKMMLSAAKIGIGYWFGSLAVMSDGMHDITDVGYGILIGLSVYMMMRPANYQHPFGRARLEYVMTGVVGVVILYAGITVLIESAERMFHPTPVPREPLLFGVLLASVIVQTGLIGGLRYWYRRTRSDMMRALVADGFSDMVITLGVLLALAIEIEIGWQIDAYVGAMVALMLLVTGVRILHRGLDKLLGKRVSASDERDILAFIASCPGVHGAHDLIVHDYGPGYKFMTCHIEVDSRSSFLEAHHIADNVERRMEMKYDVQALVHMDPRNLADPEAAMAENEVRRALALLDPNWIAHDIYATSTEMGWEISFDVSVGDSKESDVQIVQNIQEAVHRYHPEYRLMIRIDRHYLSHMPETDGEEDMQAGNVR